MSSAELTWRANAEASLLQARQRRGARLGSKKSRNGCSHCKARRIKCDEIRPECRKCHDGGRICKYGSPSPPSSRGKNGVSLIGAPLSQLLGLRQIDRRTFDYFISYTAPRLAGAWDKEFWCNNVLQLAQREPFVLDSLLAISVLYEHPQYLASFTGKPGESPAPDHPGTSFESPPGLDNHHQRALQLYNQAIRRFTTQMDEGKATQPVALLSCVLFICIETIRDNVFGAMGLFVQGMNMLKRVDREHLTSGERSLLTLIEHIFQRMSVQAVLYGHHLGPSLRKDIQASAHQEFETLAEARSALFSLAVYSHSFLQQADDFTQTLINAKLSDPKNAEDRPCDYLNGVEIFGITRDPQSIFYPLAADDDPEDYIEKHGAFNALRSFFDRLGAESNTNKLWDPEDLFAQRTDILTRLDRWNIDFGALLKRDPGQQQAPEAISYLRLYHLASHVWTSTRLETTELVFDHFTLQFRELIRHAEVYVRATALQFPIFTFEIGAVLPLFFMGSKCRVPSLRRQALDLILQCPRKESTFGAYSCAQAICRLIAIEEEGLGLPDPDLSGRCGLRNIDDSVVVPEDRRVHSFDLLKNRRERHYELRVTRYRTRNGTFERVVQNFAV